MAMELPMQLPLDMATGAAQATSCPGQLALGADTGSHTAIATAVDIDTCSPRWVLLLR